MIQVKNQRSKICALAISEDFALYLIYRISYGVCVEYWEHRKKYHYYAEVICLAKKFAPFALSVIDVGSRDVPLVTELNWIPNKWAIDLDITPQFPGVRGINGDFLNFIPSNPFDLVLCLQVLEHLEQPEIFTQKLLRSGKTIIISVPFEWPKEFCKWHKQDPIDEKKLFSWTHFPSKEKLIIEDAGLSRLIAVFDGFSILA
jgi:hypothetical protein